MRALYEIFQLMSTLKMALWECTMTLTLIFSFNSIELPQLWALTKYKTSPFWWRRCCCSQAKGTVSRWRKELISQRREINLIVLKTTPILTSCRHVPLYNNTITPDVALTVGPGSPGWPTAPGFPAVPFKQTTAINSLTYTSCFWCRR